MTKTRRQALDKFVQVVKDGVDGCFTQQAFDSLERAADLINEVVLVGRRVHISGIGKPAHIAGYAASLFSSTGTPAYFLHGTEAVHGSCGQLVPGDVVLFVSNSGETAEMRATVLAIRSNGCHVIGISGNDASWLAQHSDVHINAGVAEEGGPLNRAPRMSIIAETLILQALSVILQSDRDITPQQYVRWHPGGKLGELRDNEK